MRGPDAKLAPLRVLYSIQRNCHSAAVKVLLLSAAAQTSSWTGRPYCKQCISASIWLLKVLTPQLTIGWPQGNLPSAPIPPIDVFPEAPDGFLMGGPGHDDTLSQYLSNLGQIQHANGLEFFGGPASTDDAAAAPFAAVPGEFAATLLHLTLCQLSHTFKAVADRIMGFCWLQSPNAPDMRVTIRAISSHP